MNRMQVLAMAVRPRTLPASLAPVLLGTAAAWGAGAFRPLAALAALAGAILLQVGANLANDVFDFFRGADGPDRKGPTRVTQAGLMQPREVLAWMAAAFVLATSAGAYLVWIGGWPIAVIGTLGILSGILYTGGPWPLAYHGLGDLFAFVFFGPVAVGGTYYVQTGTVTAPVLAAGAALGCITTAILAVNNQRDREQDARVGKRTLAVRLGLRGSRIYYAVLVAAPYGIALAAAPGFRSLLPLLSLPLAASLVAVVLTREDGPSLNEALAGTGRLLALFSLLWLPAWL